MTLEIAKIIKNKAPTLWNSSLKTMNKRDVLDFINEEAFVLSNEFYFGTSRTYLAAFICEGPKGALKVFDLRNDPNQFIGLEFQELKKIIDKTKPRIIRSIMQNKHPILMPPEPKFINSVVGYENIGIEELNRRANIIKHNIDFNSQLKRLIFEEKEEESHDQSDKEPEECIYSFGFASFQEKALMTKFHASDCQGKLEIADQFQNSHHNDFQAFQRGKIYSEFAKMILYEENKEILPEEEKQRIKKKLADRIFYPDTDTVRSSWNNVGRAHMQIEAMGNKFEDEGHKDNSKEVIFLFKIKELIEKIENEYGGY